MRPETDPAPGVLLDTHIWVRLQTMSRPLSPGALKAIQIAAASRTVFVPVISAWEVAMLIRRKRLELYMPVNQWIAAALDKPGINLLPLSLDIALAAAGLPEPMHKDPADRMIVASALVERLVLITRDEPMLRFARHIGLDCVEG